MACWGPGAAVWWLRGAHHVGSLGGDEDSGFHQKGNEILLEIESREDMILFSIWDAHSG